MNRIDAGEPVDVELLVRGEIKDAAQRVDELRRRVLLTSLFETRVVVNAHSRESGDFFTAKARDPTPSPRKPDSLRINRGASGTKILTKLIPRSVIRGFHM